MKKLHITRQETKDGIMLRVRTENAILNNTERVIKCIDTNLSKNDQVKELKKLVNNVIIGL